MNPAAKRKSILAAWLCALIVVLCPGETRAREIFDAPQPASGQIQAASPEGVGENYDASAYDAPGYAVAPKRGLTNPELLGKAGQKAFDRIPGKGGAVGTARHEYATKLLERYQGIYGDKGLRFKETRSLFGQKSILDARDINSKTIFDWKFGNSARMSPAQRAKYQSHYPDHTIQVEKYLYP